MENVMVKKSDSNNQEITKDPEFKSYEDYEKYYFPNHVKAKEDEENY
jgi:hypothetical protein